jgi:hypothetical protein
MIAISRLVPRVSEKIGLSPEKDTTNDSGLPIRVYAAQL